MSEFKTDPRPANCTHRLRDEGKRNPKSGCMSCGDGGMRGCPYDGSRKQSAPPAAPEPTKDDGGPAFPLGNTPEEWMNGMTLRDWFAGQALAGMMSRHQGYPGTSAHAAYVIADAMLAERSRT